MKFKLLLNSLFKSIHRLIFRFTIESNERVTPMNSTFGYHRGEPIDRYYIAKAVSKYSDKINGKTLEVGERRYTKQFSNVNISDSYILNYSEMGGHNQIIGDLTNLGSFKGQKFDTFICTQTLNFIYDFQSAINTSFEILNKGSYFIGTVGSVSHISKYDNDRWGDYWRFTQKSIKKALDESNFSVLDVTGYGNILAAKAMFDGCVTEDFDDPSLLDHVDPIYPLVISFLCLKE
tara:strand:- start:4760 stop:5461 length:702 start_codon:yes stop_codon:yes gene_type:complete